MSLQHYHPNKANAFRIHGCSYLFPVSFPLSMRIPNNSTICLRDCRSHSGPVSGETSLVLTVCRSPIKTRVPPQHARHAAPAAILAQVTANPPGAILAPVTLVRLEYPNISNQIQRSWIFLLGALHRLAVASLKSRRHRVMWRAILAPVSVPKPATILEPVLERPAKDRGAHSDVCVEQNQQCGLDGLPFRPPVYVCVCTPLSFANSAEQTHFKRNEKQGPDVS